MQVLKRKCREGTGTFPVDAPVHDATVTVQYSLHEPSVSKQAGSCIFTASGDVDGARQLHATFSTGEGCMAPALEMAVRLMLPGERSEVYFEAKYGFKDTSEAPADVPVDRALVAMLTLVSFEKEGHPQAMDADEVCCAVLCCLHTLLSCSLHVSAMLSARISVRCKLQAEDLDSVCRLSSSVEGKKTGETRCMVLASLSSLSSALMRLCKL